MAYFLHFLEVGGDEEHGAAAFVGDPQIAIDLRFGANVHPDRWLLEDEKAHIGFHPPRDNHLLLIAAAQRGDGSRRVGRPDGEPRQRLAASRQFSTARDRVEWPNTPSQWIHVARRCRSMRFTHFRHALESEIIAKRLRFGFHSSSLSYDSGPIRSVTSSRRKGWISPSWHAFFRLGRTIRLRRGRYLVIAGRGRYYRARPLHCHHANLERCRAFDPHLFSP